MRLLHFDWLLNRCLDTREYLRIIRYNVIQREFHIHNIDRNNIRWQQDGAPAHTSNATMQYLRGQFPLRLMSKRGDWPWPPRSPDLAICDFFLWGYLKQQIWDVRQDQLPQNLKDLRISIFNCGSMQYSGTTNDPRLL